MSEHHDEHQALSEAFATLAEMTGRSELCSSPPEIWRALLGELPAEQARALVEHSASCGSCSAAWRLARSIADEAGIPPVATDGTALLSNRAGSTRTGWWLAAAASILLVAAAFLFFNRGASDDPWRDLVIAKAPYVRPVSAGDVVWRDPAGAADAEAARLFSVAMQPYEREDFAGAERSLAAFIADHPAHARARFYLGVCQLMNDRPAVARSSFESAILGDDRTLREEALWYLALACVKQGRRTEALERLQAIAAGSSTHREEALGLLVRLRSSRADGPR